MLFVNLLGVLLIAGIAWWFWMYRAPDAAVATQGIIEIVVENGVYVPARVEVPAGQPTTLRFLRKDASPCAGTVLFSDLNISEDLPVNKSRDIVVNPPTAGIYPFTCQMQMYRGELRVTDAG